MNSIKALQVYTRANLKSIAAKISQTEVVVMNTRERDTCFGERGLGRDYSGLISLGMFLIIVGIVFVIDRNLFSDFELWIKQVTEEQVLTRPPESLITSAMIFFGLIGLSDFFKAGIRLWIDKSKKRVLGDILSGIALVLFTYLIHLYAIYALTWQQVLAIEAIAVGLLVIFYSIVRYMFLK